MKITNPIIPSSPIEVFVETKGELDFKAICVFAAIGFFLEEDTYWTHKKILSPAAFHELDNHHKLLTSKPYFNWHYSPRTISFNQALEEFTSLFETIIMERTKGRRVILPLSGGLDSRTQAVALKHIGAEVSSYSYEFENGYSETKIAKQIAAVCGFDFQSFKIKKGYLWKKLVDLAKLNGCCSDFTSPRQMAIADEFASMGDVFSLGHWGDVLFDSYNCETMSHEAQVEFLSNKLLKRGGLEFASRLWQTWGLEGDFKSYFFNRISSALNTIKIEDTNARLRAFKSKYWAPRWTSVNLSVFEHYKPITLPYYDNRMCEFICTVPEDYLKDRQLQIAYIKRRNPKLAELTWQDKRPYNLYDFNKPTAIKTFSYKVLNKLKREAKQISGNPYNQRNWELQFLGEDNRKQLENVLNESKLSDFIPEGIISTYIDKFYNKNALQNAHALNMLLVLAKFNQTQNNG
ncbi:asparagine synthase-related protein [Winogradskyella jejuensis]|uniref:asparagine synthase (glutamine-hydrolyzing) n=1 Tax=Winogradskyella jejuensis TaxID=1089305 RepID=A0A1M5SMG1_9FLAO|nr:asparagine synthase-related protein [Winogradskyella jejuensis]SHH39103.1 Asparagine synthase [Winogradskyella jejuensis]